MGGISIVKDTRFILDHQLHVVQAILPGNKYRVLNLSNNEAYTMSFQEIAKAHSERVEGTNETRLKFEVFGRNARKNPHEPINTKFLYSDLDEVESKAAKDEAWRRYELILDLYAFHREERLVRLTRTQISEFVLARGLGSKSKKRGKSADSTSVYSIERYMKDFLAGDGSILALVPNFEQQGGEGISRLDEEVESIIQRVLDKYVAITDREKSFDDVMSNIINAIGETNKYLSATAKLEPPDDTTVRDRIDKRGRKLVLGRKPSPSEQQKGSSKSIQEPPERIGQIYEIDSARLPIFVVDEKNRLVLGRPWICVVTDRCSRVPVGWAMKFGKQGYELIRMALRHAFSEKPDYKALYGTQNNLDNVYNIPEKVKTDQGNDYKGKNLQSVAAILRFRLERLPKRKPWYKGGIERFIRSQNQGALRGQPGYAFENIFAKGDYDPIGDAVISFEALKKIMAIWFIDIFCQRWHKGLKGIPIQRWDQQWNSGLMLPFPPNQNEVHYGLMPYDECHLGSRVRWNNGEFGGENLAYLREIYGTEDLVKFHHDPDDFMKLYFKDLHSDKWIDLVNLEPWYAEGLTVYQHEVFVDYLNAEKKKVNIENLALAKEHVQQLVVSEFNITRNTTVRGKHYGTFTDLTQNPPTRQTPDSTPLNPSNSFRRPGSINESYDDDESYDDNE